MDRKAMEIVAHALAVAALRAWEHGEKLVALGKPDINRGQFLALVKDALETAERAGATLPDEAAYLLARLRKEVL